MGGRCSGGGCCVGGRIGAHGSGHGCLGLGVGGAGAVGVPGVFEEVGGDAGHIVVELGGDVWLIGIIFGIVVRGDVPCA